MPTAATLSAKSRYGYSQAASRLGWPTVVYRPSGAGNPIASGNIVETINAAFDTSPQFSFVNPQKFGNSTYYAMMDATLVQPGDYLVQRGQTYFVATVDDYAAPMVQRCDIVLTVKRPVAVAGEYSGDLRAQETALLTSWPAAITEGPKGQAGAAGLPGDPRMPWWKFILPVSVPVQLRASDVAEDAQAQPMRYILSSVEHTALGLRLTAGQAVA